MSQKQKKVYLSLFHHDYLLQYFISYFEYNKNYTVYLNKDENHCLNELDEADCIITDDFNVKINGNQKLVFIPLLDQDKDHYISIQNKLRLSEYNIYESKNDAIEILNFYGLTDLLCNTNLYYSNNTFSLVEVNNINRILVYVDIIQNESQAKMVENFLTSIDNPCVVSPQMKNYDFIKSIDHSIPYIVYTPSKYSFKQKFKIKYLMNIAKIRKSMNSLFRKNVNKSLSKLKYQKLIYLFDHTQYTSRELAMLDQQIDYVEIDKHYIGTKALNKTLIHNKNILKQKCNILDKQISYITDVNNPDISMSQSVSFYMDKFKIKRKNDYYYFCMYIQDRSIFKFPYNELELFLEDQYINSEIIQTHKGFKIIFNLSFEQLVNLPAQNKLFLKYKDDKNIGFVKDIYFTTRKYISKDYLKSKIMNIDGKTSFYLRQSLKNRVYLTVRLHNRTDSFVENLKINIAYYLSHCFKNKDVYLLYEKDSSRYEESASVVFEKLIDMGYKQAYFILDRNYPDLDKINQKYRSHIIYKYTFKHYLYFFISKVFLGSELMVHAMELRIMNKHVLKRIYSTDIHNVFLQHGVMYMVSLDSASRKYFSPKKDGKGKFRVVTSSKEEARHFIELGGYNPNQIIISGLPKYDRNILYPDASKIVIMPTWRVWEYNQATTDFSTTPYYKMLERIVSGLKDEYLDNLIILPHPLFYKAAMNNDFELKKYMQFNVKYDEILRQTRVLITDYSSIAYDAFYRGSRVIFYWEELEQCLQNYGENTKLMLNDTNVFGDVCYCKEDVQRIIDDNYHYPQKELYVKRYEQLVEFHDGKNTERLITQLKKDKIIK